LHPHIRGREFIERIVLGGSDGVIESVSVTAGLNGASLGFRTILVAGLAFAIAGAFSMFVSNYLSRKSELRSLKTDMEREKLEIETEPEEEKMELRELLKEDGFHDKEIAAILDRVTKDKEMWLRVQLRQELHLHVEDLESSPLRKSLPAGFTFFVCAMIPLVPYLITNNYVLALYASIVLAVSSLFLLGATHFISLDRDNLRNGFEMAAIGGGAAIALYFVGHLISSL
jgi:VIT1/CCC1 family predicted Fe2+/Mn2+ transporter